MSEETMVMGGTYASPRPIGSGTKAEPSPTAALRTIDPEVSRIIDKAEGLMRDMLVIGCAIVRDAARERDSEYKRDAAIAACDAMGKAISSLNTLREFAPPIRPEQAAATAQ